MKTHPKGCFGDFNLPEPQSILNFHSGSEFSSKLSAYKGVQKFMNFKTAGKVPFLSLKGWTFNDTNKYKNQFLKKISPLSNAEFYCLSGVFINFGVYPTVKKIWTPQMEYVEANFHQKRSKIVNKSPREVPPPVFMPNMICFRHLQPCQHTKNELNNPLGFSNYHWRDIFSKERIPAVCELLDY